MKIISIRLNVFSTNCYIIQKDNECLLIDPGTNSQNEILKIKKQIEQNKLLAILFTHVHFDHIAAANYFDITSYMHKNDFELLKNQEQLALRHANQIINLPKKINSFEKLNDEIKEKFNLEIIHTPGHTPGSVCFKFEDNLITGDTLFVGTYGRTDVGGNDTDMFKSLKKLSTYPDNLTIYPGHGYFGKLKNEKEWIKKLN